MSRRERDHTQPVDSLGGEHRDPPEPVESSSAAEDSAAHIAELVRRTTERHAAPGSAPVAPSTAAPSTAAPSTAAPSTTAPSTTAPSTPAPSTPMLPSPTVVQRPVATPVPLAVRPDAPRVAQHRWRRNLLAGGTVVILLVGGGLALSGAFESDARTPPVAAAKAVAPAGYSVKVTDAITDCASHSRGRTKSSFEAQNCVKATRVLATGQVGGRKVLFVVSRIEMPSAEAAAAVKQVLDGSGTGNLDDLLREGKTFAGAPAKMPSSGYSSVQTGKVVTVAEAGFIDGGRSASTDPSLRAAASGVSGFVSAQG